VTQAYTADKEQSWQHVPATSQRLRSIEGQQTGNAKCTVVDFFGFSKK
jgi:hypothetical protein